jgi:hypothetical protein
MYPQARKLIVSFFLVLFLSAISFTQDVYNDELPEVTDRVARISAIEGDVRVRRADSEEWEEAVMNLPIVEGDEISSEPDSRFEVQFSSTRHMRGDELTVVRVVTLQDEGIAVSLPQGTISVRLDEFDPDSAFFEVDAPQTTIALREDGTYRVDAGQAGDTFVRVSIGDEGEARVYSVNSGFMLRSGRSARVFTEGSYAGEWEMGSSAELADAFQNWVFDRQTVIAERLRDAHYDRYYDRDIYGAEDLTDYGDWVHTRDYGYVWRPWRSSYSAYADWSPYRYGEWRWLSPYGWTWVNAEPWGWATYHYGRWVWYNGFWHWAPYSSYRAGRSWWRPALVVFTTWNNNYCWYPLPYYYPYYNYNYHYYANNRRRRHNRSSGGQTSPSPTPAPPAGNTPILTAEQRRARRTTPPLQNIPPNGVVTVAKSDFGKTRSGFKTPPLSTARDVLSKSPASGDTPPILPTYEDSERKSSWAVSQKPTGVDRTETIKTGALDRTERAPLDNKLRKTRILGNRPPLEINTGSGDVKVPAERGLPRTGAVERKVPVTEKSPPVGQSPPIYVPPQSVTSKPAEQKRETPVVRQPAPARTFPQQQTRRETAEPRSTPTRAVPQRRAEPPMQRQAPRSAPAPRSQPSAPMQRPSRSTPPVQRSRPQPKSEPSKPAPKTESKGKDGD